jgi:ubiquinone/menaquinone biosynthesis C-methylase UbiE
MNYEYKGTKEKEVHLVGGMAINMTEKAKFFVHRIINSLGYEIHRVPSLKDTLIPPSYIRTLVGPFSNADSYTAVGKDFFKYFKDLCGLKPNEDVLDVGCGCGRMAAPLTKYLNRSSTYEGFDVVPVMFKWCVTNISSKYQNFHFQLADIYNKRYNPKGQFKASEYRFPYQDESFDFVFLTSVFTHMLPQDMENYFSEVSRVLKKGQRCLITYFLLNAQSLALIEAKLSTLDFKHVFGNYRTISKATPETAIAYAEEYIRALYEKFGLAIVNPIQYGSWCGREDFLSYQDIIVAVKL